MKSFSKISLYIFVVISLFSLPLITLADKYTPLVEIPGLTSGANTNADIGPYVSGLYRWVISISIAIAVVMFTFHAFGYLLSESTVTSKSKAKEGMVNVIIGLVLIFSAYLILKTINPQLINLKFNTVLPTDTVSEQNKTSCANGGTPVKQGIYIKKVSSCSVSLNGKTVTYDQITYQDFTGTDFAACEASINGQIKTICVQLGSCLVVQGRQYEDLTNKYIDYTGKSFFAPYKCDNEVALLNTKLTTGGVKRFVNLTCSAVQNCSGAQQ